MCGTMWHILAPGIAAAGSVQPTPPEIFEVLWPERDEGHTGELCLAPFGESHVPTHFHTYHRSTCKFWWDSDAPEVTPPKRRSVGHGGLHP